ncbi:ACP S-malonyltransferase [Thermodesulforhabdus norvegica]|uniref:Malonyl CoA-acyl carrier protein transacylase n=1 Tax=Thermodesulforhabdus norvegica TaxID=39841 RepID=A0A1I4VEU2_9BACT|nr:ACP S-malonyltransferase [Thermodesulforhabdus norvegica]SFM99630.1 [acyl-carrier-protein] S-malonyltransferase [Thermodesulforhabdus norvegica]
MMKWVFLFPGQGSQYVGMGKIFYEEYREIRSLFEEAGDLLKMDLVKLCFDGPEEELVKTRNVQPAITVVNIACYRVLEMHGIYPVAAAGHSLGEYSALYAAGVLSLHDVLKLVKARGEYMDEAAQKNPGGMLAVIGADDDTVARICIESGAEIANINSYDQIILTGSYDEIKAAERLCKELKVRRCIRLNVSGPWHSKYMKGAQEKFLDFLNKCDFRDPRIPIVANLDGRPVSNGEDARYKLGKQISSSVMWRQSMEWFIGNGYSHFVEVGPKQVLGGIAKKIDKSCVVAGVEDSETLLRFLQRNNNRS